MNYAKDYKNDNHSISVNTLIKPQRKPNLSVVSHDDTIEQREAVQTGDASLPVAPRQDIASNNPAVSNTGQAEAQTAPAVDLSAQSSETAAVPGEQTLSSADNTAESTEAGPAQAVQPETAPDTPAQGVETGAAEPVETGTAPLPEGESLPQAEDILLEAEEESKSNKEPDRPKHKIMAAAASGADSNAGSRTPEAVQLAGNNTGSGLGENSPGLSQSGDALNSVRNGGEPLPEGLRRNMENAMATDFKNVHLHRDGPSAAMAGEMGAKAFTHREDIYFNQGQYNPDTTGGRRLIAHELAHVEQQRTIPGLQYKLEVPGERDRYEQEADAVADKVVNSPAPVQSAGGQSAPAVTKSSSGSIQRAKEESSSSWFSEKIGGMLKNIPGYDMLILVIGRDPVSVREVKRDGIAFIKAIVGLIPGGKLLLENLEKAGVISRAVAWFKDGFQALNISFGAIKSLFDQALKSIGWNLIKSFEKIKNIFMAPIRRIGNFLGQAGPKLMEFIFEGALTLAGAPVKAIMGILNKGKAVLGKIIKDPIGFLKNLLSAVKGGLGNFVANIVTHLQNGIGGWIFGALGKAGITLPGQLNLAGIFHIAAQVLGVTWRAIKTLVVKRLGAMGEKIMGQVEKSIDFVVTLITKGPMALLEMAKDFLAELKTLFFDTLIEWVRNTIVVKAIQKLISMFNPVGAIIQAVITIYHTIQFFIERAKQIAAFVGAVFNSIVEIAGGNIGKAIAAVEDALAKGVPVAISFLANLLGLGGIEKKVQEIIKKIRKPIDKVVGKVVGFVVGKAKQIWAKMVSTGKAVVEGGKGAVGKVIAWWKTRKGFTTQSGEKHTLYFQGKGANARLMIASTPMDLKQYLDDNKEEFTKTNKPAFDAADEAIKSIEQIKAETKIVDLDQKEGKKALKDRNDKIVQEVDKLSTALRLLMGVSETDGPKEHELAGDIVKGEKNPKTASVWNLTAQNVDKQDKNGIKGSKPKSNSSPGGWEVIRNYAQTDPKVIDQWVRMHLINDNIGGPGIEGNLIPGPSIVNVQMEKYAENPIKAILRKTKATQNKNAPSVLWVTTNVEYHTEKVEYDTDEVKNNTKKLENLQWAKKIQVTAGYYYPKQEKNTGGSTTIWEKENAAAFSQDFEIPLPRFAKKEVEFNEEGNRGALLELNFKSAGVDRSDFKTRLDWWIRKGGKKLGPFDNPQQVREKTLNAITNMDQFEMAQFETELEFLKQVGLSFKKK